MDYWRIQQKDVIDDVTGTTQLIRDEELLDGAVQKALAAGTPRNQINLGSGTAAYVGNPKVVRNAVTAADLADFDAFNATRPAAQQRVPVGGVKSVVTDYVNLAGREVQGLDVGFEFRLPKTRFGQGEMANVTALATWVAAESRGLRFNLSQAHPEERRSQKSFISIHR